MSNQQVFPNINIALGLKPNDFDIAFASIDLEKNTGDLNLTVLRAYGYDIKELSKLDVTNGFGVLVKDARKQIIFVVTHGMASPKVSLELNLETAIRRNQKRLQGKSIWVPLMATGSGGITLFDSYETTTKILSKFENLYFTLSIPNDQTGKSLHFSLNKEASAKIDDLMGAKVPVEISMSEQSEENESPIKGVDNIVYGKELGKELFNYDVFILPKSGVGGVGKNGIAAKVLEILGIQRESFDFDEFHLRTRRYRWFTQDLNGRIVYLGFIVTRDENKNKLDFKKQLNDAIIALDRFNSVKGKVDKKTNIFIPFLGAGQAGMSHIESLHKIIAGIQLIRATIPSHKIRINFPPSISEKDERDFLKYLSTQLSGPPPPPGIFTVENDELFDKIAKEDSETSEDSVVDKIPFHLDQVVDEDRLGREPVAKAFVDLIKKDIFTDKLNHSFMVHLQGKWGAGKSSFLNFIKQNLNSDIEKWIIVDYNAWQNQHINPPWWSLINQVYLQSKEQFYLIGIRKSLHLWRKEIFRRIWRYSGWQKILALTFFILFIICILYFGNDILEMFNNASNPDSDNEVLGQLGNILKLVLTSISLLTSIYGFAKFITFPFFINSSKDAKSFVLKASDPMNQVKRHFNDLVDDINSIKKKQQLAIFIDDIDRCDKENIVCLLEGIQTLFKEKRVLYIIAGDKDWISTSFGNTYEEFTTTSVDKKQLGELFIQKAFQLSFRLPNISEESKQNYWNHILGMKPMDEAKKVNSIDELSQEEQIEIKSVLKESKSQLTDPEFVKGFQEKFNLTGDTASNIVIEEKNKDTEELRHLLQEYHKFIDTNPRSIIRLANNYTMARSILMAERVAFNEHILFRWLVIEDLCPKVITLVATVEKMEEFEEVINKNHDVVKRNKAIKLLKSGEEFMEGEMTIDDIKTIKGL